jgi:MFS family permease
MNSNRRYSKVFYGWYIVAASVIIILYTGGIVHFGFTAVFEPIAEEFDWSYAQVSLASSLRGFEMGLLAPIVGLLVDRLGPRRLIFVGSILVCLGFLLLSRVSSLAMFYGSFVLIAIGTSTCTGTVLMTAVANWFRRKAGLVMGIVASGFGLGGLIVPVVTGLIDLLEWRTAILTVGLGMLVIVLPLSFVIRHKPEHYGYQPDGDTTDESEIGENQIVTVSPEVNIPAKQALSGRLFWQIAISSACHAFVIGAVVTHMMPYLSSLGIDRSVSSLVALILPVLSICGRLSSSWFIDRIGSNKVFAASFALMTIGMLFLGYITIERIWLLLPFIITLSLGWGCSVTTRLTLIREHYGRISFGTIMGSMSGIMMLGNVAGAPLAGLIFDIRGSYHIAWLSYSVIALLGVFLASTIPHSSNTIRLLEKRNNQPVVK